MKQVGAAVAGSLLQPFLSSNTQQLRTSGPLDPLASQGKPEVWMFLCNILNVQGWQLIFTFSKKHRCKGQTQRASRPSRPTGHQLEPLVVSTWFRRP